MAIHGKEALLKFCGSYGLLGLFPWSVRRIVLDKQTYERTGAIWSIGDNSHKEQPHVEHVSFTTGLLENTSAKDIVRKHFPGVSNDQRDAFEIPRPFTTKFWHAYSESLFDWLHAAVYLDSVRHGLQSARLGNEARTDLNRLLSDAVPSVIRKRGRTRWSFTCGSLLGYFALMLVQDSAQGLKLLECPVCGVPFASDNWQATYCSEQHRWVGQKRAQRFS